MNDIRRTILWVVFGFSLVLLWDQWQVFNGRNPTFLPSTKPPASATAPAAAPPGAASSSAVPQAANTTPAGASGAATVPDGKTTAPTASERVVVTTDVLKLTFDTEGGSLVQSEFIQHDDLTEKDKPFVLLDQSPNRYYVAQTGLIGGSFPTHKTPMSVSGERTLKDGANELVLRFESADLGGVKLVKTWTLKRGGYDMRVRHEIVNTGTAPVSPQVYLQIVRDGNKPPGESSFYSTFTGPAVYTEAKKYQKIEFKDIENNKADFVKEATNGYVAMVQHYFASAWLLKDGVPRDLFARKVDTNLYAVGMITPAGPVEPGASKAIDAEFFVGPQAEKTLEAVAPGLELVKDYGIFTIISKPLYWLLDKLHTMLGNWGWAIVALVVVLKAAFYWLNAKAYASMAKMKAINPKVMEMRERLKDKPQEMQQEMMRIYREEKVNPMGGCFPILVQIPVFIALYWVLLSSVEMRHAPWIGWIKDLSAPDPWFILPIVMTATSLFQTWLNPTPPDPMQAKLMWIMPLAFSVMFIFFPAGLVLYWITNNVLSIAQQWFINKRLGVLGK
ncbi:MULTISPECIES: membrane protein insertase YidC [unclassified Variovorax]|uniref:membrane protein insertase YidC n=1 Tax=unclassified Variovorax TaxID=663243 RepID=UPI00076CA77E|nr:MULTISPECIES: membrane protein insertase YidC [unclassified Variovorax]KWT96912.1 Inner membrane protein translocase component YidC, long form [Variovorax sp. WDL1]PNG58701.1 Membrane protein insertase YidC [Variovorax sp. B4]PNG61509.1 Membrane protein insertase YidC [Variovorax sp. B2]VTV12468.1 Oxa1Ec [Variovorax sp. WDL1]